MLKSDLNPALKAGDKIILLKGNNGNSQFEGKIGVVQGSRKNRAKSNTSVKFGDINTTIYFTGPADEFKFANKEAILEGLADRKTTLQKELKDVENSIEYHNKYETEEDYVADKLNTLFETFNGSENKAKRIKAMAEALKTLKSSDIL